MLILDLGLKTQRRRSVRKSKGQTDKDRTDNDIDWTAMIACVVKIMIATSHKAADTQAVVEKARVEGARNSLP